MASVYAPELRKARRLAERLRKYTLTIPSHPSYEAEKEGCDNPICSATFKLQDAIKEFLDAHGETFGDKPSIH